MAPSYPQTGKLASAARTKGSFVKKPRSPNLGDNLNTVSSDDDEDLPHIGRTSGTNPEDPKNLHGVNAGNNTLRTPCANMISPRKREFSPLGEEANMRTHKRAAATLTALRAGSDTPKEVPEPHYPQGTSHLVQDTDNNSSNSCWRRRPFVAPSNVEKLSTSSRVTRMTSSLQDCSKPVHSQVYLTGSYTKPSNDNSHWHREPFLIPKNVEKSFTCPASSRIKRKTSRLQYSSNLVHSLVYATGSCHKQPTDHSCWRREPFGVPKNVEKSSTSTESSRVSREMPSLRYSSKPVHSPVYATGSCANRSNDNSCQHREPFVIAKNVEKTSTLSTSSHINCETSSPQNRSMLVHSPVYVTGNCAKQSNNNSRLCREPVLSGGNVKKTSTPPTPSHNHCETLSALSENECTHSNMDIKAMSSRSTQTHRLSSLPDCPQMASDPAWTQQRDQVQEDGEAPRSRLSKKLLDFFQVPSEWRTGSDELLLRLKAQKIIGEKVKGRCSESTEAQGKPLLPRLNPKLLPKKAKSPTSDEVTKVCRSAMWQKKEPSKENPQMSGQPSTPGPILGDKWPSSVTSPRQRISGSNLPQNPSSNAGENQTNPHGDFTRKTSSKTLLEDNRHLKRWYHKATWMAELLTFTPHIDRVKWDWLNNGPTRLPDTKWSGKNDTEIFWQWYTTLLGSLTSQGYRGAHYDEIHLDCLIGGLAEPALSHGLKLREEALLRDKGGKFLEVLDTLMRTYIKEPATLKVTEKYCNVKYNAGKGPRQSYPEPLLNARFLENILPECKEEIIKMGFSSFEEMFRTTSRMDEMKNRLRIAPAYRPECYARPETTATTNREKPNQAGKEKHAEARANVQDPKPKWKGESSLKQSGNTNQRPVQAKSCPEHQLVGDRNPRHRIAREVDYKTEGEVGDGSDEEEPENISGDFEVEDTSNDFEPEDPNKGPHYSPRRKGEDISVGTTIMAPRSNVIENNDEKNTLKLAISQTKKRTTNSLVMTPKRDTPEKKTSEGDPLKEDPLGGTTPESPEEDELWVEFILGWLAATICPLPSRNTGLHHARLADKANQPSSYLKEDQELADKIK
ncbi:uncharacterized protein EI90DRAFT_3023408 [Cantharellus anzutake]|uniref:uncharacterized protein n=1 Tax=Cantharellus anzutake TaxID=1750568 RepID=UPI001904691A|nr:uncharacterized protein EI90DRAFT_3023408 [Cantharellus anzutake]KAF8311779.1 hypothetical protein EI90DRAFT_3023408 [Cantharellus anzutake]